MKSVREVRGRRAVLSLVLLALILAAFALPAAANDPGGRPFYVEMTGAAEAPGPGDPDGSGIATFTLNQGQGVICYTLEVENIDPATAAHIHRAPAGSPGPVVVPLAAPTPGSSSGCVEVDPALIKEIRQNPEAFYVNVHNAVYPGGAVRGQLGK
jgi:hypothetical protein